MAEIYQRADGTWWARNITRNGQPTNQEYGPQATPDEIMDGLRRIEGRDAASKAYVRSDDGVTLTMEFLQSAQLTRFRLLYLSDPGRAWREIVMGADNWWGAHSLMVRREVFKDDTEAFAQWCGDAERAAIQG